MTEIAITIRDLGKMYRLYQRPADKILDAVGINRCLFWRRQYYQEFWALRDLNLEVKKGERLGIIGRNGAGKSTLLKIITDNITPTEGTVAVRGRVQALMELGTGFHPEFTGLENIRASLAYQGMSPKEIRSKEEEIIDFSELEDFIEQPIKTYSAGMYARLAFSTATVIQPEILIIDEVLGAGDAYFSGKCVERMRKLTEDSGATVLFVSHDLGSVQALCNRLIWINRGILQADGDPLNIIKQYSVMVRRDEEIRLKARDLKISKKQAVLLERRQDIYETMLFRLIGVEGGHPSGTHKIRSLSLWSDSEKIGEIDVGAPMDNHPDQDHYLMNEAGFMDWGVTGKDELGYYRSYANFNSKYAHAPFEFSVPKSYLLNAANFKLAIQANCQHKCVALELFLSNKNTYHRLGILNDGESLTELVFDLDLFIDLKTDTQKYIDDPELNTSKNVSYDSFIPGHTDESGSKEIFITKVALLDDNEQETKILSCLKSFKVIIEYLAGDPIDNPTFVFCIYLPSGMTACQWVISAKDLGEKVLKGKGKVILSGRSLLLGRGSYVASAAIFKWYPRPGIQPEAYHLLDRCIHFQVRNTDEIETIDYGICRQPIETELQIFKIVS